jgi:DNA primase
VDTTTQKIKQVDLKSVVERVGIQLRRQGQYYVGLCPFHEEKTPSFTVFQDNSFHCFGCRAHGDAVDLIKHCYKLNFPDALRFLGIDSKPLPPKKLKQIKTAKQAKERAENVFRQTCYTLATEIRRYRQAMAAATLDTFHKLTFLHKLDLYSWYHNLLLYGNREQRALVLKELRNLELITPNKIFRPEFDFEKWLNNFVYGANNDNSTNYPETNRAIDFSVSKPCRDANKR